MKKTSLALLVCFCSLSLFAQYEKILADPTVSWVAEIELTLTPEAGCEDWPFDWPTDSLNTSTVLKTVSTAPEDTLYRDPQTLHERLFDLMITGRWPAFADAGLTLPLSAEECLERYCQMSDNHMLFDPEEPGEQVSLTKPELVRFGCPPSGLRLVKVRQLLIYRDKTASFDLVTLAIDPFVWWSGDSAPIWLAVPPPGRKTHPDLADRDIVWARRLHTRGATPDVAALHSLKRAEAPLLRSFLHRARTDPSLTLFDSEWKVSPFKDREALLNLNRTDTLVTYDPETSAEQIQLVRREKGIESLRYLRLVQDWYWDGRRERLIVRLVAVAPMVEVLDDDGSVRYSRPVFYRKSD